MKKYIILLISILFNLNTYSQAFTAVEITAERGGQAPLVELFDEYFGDAKFKSGGVNLERLWMGNLNTHRIVFFGELGNSGRVEGDVQPFENSLFWSRANNYIKEWGNTSSGRIISWKGGEPGSDEKYRYIQIYDIKVSDPESFKKAHDKVTQQLSKAIGDRTVGFGSYDIGGYNGASHWVLVSAENWDDLMLQKVEYEKYTKEWEEYYKTRGEVENVRNYSFYVAKMYR